MSNRILGANGLPAGQAAPVLRPGEVPVQIGVAVAPAGVILSVALGGAVHNVPLPPGTATQLGVGLIGTEAQWQLQHARRAEAMAIVPDPGPTPGPTPGPAEDLLAEAIGRVDGS